MKTSKLTSEQVEAIKNRIKNSLIANEDVPCNDISNQYNVTRATIYYYKKQVKKEIEKNSKPNKLEILDLKNIKDENLGKLDAFFNEFIATKLKSLKAIKMYLESVEGSTSLKDIKGVIAVFNALSNAGGKEVVEKLLNDNNKEEGVLIDPDLL